MKYAMLLAAVAACASVARAEAGNWKVPRWSPILSAPDAVKSPNKIMPNHRTESRQITERNRVKSPNAIDVGGHEREMSRNSRN